MMEDELIALWQSSPKHEQIKFEKSRLMLELQASMNRFDMAIKFRDWLEIGTALVLLPIISYQVYVQPNYLAKFAALWIVLVIVFLVHKLLRARKNKPSEVDSYLEYLKNERVYLIKQKNLLENVLYWAVIPILVGFFSFLAGSLGVFNKSWQEVIRIKKVWIGLIAAIATTVTIPLLNKWSVKREINPRIKKLDELIHLMES
jgi:hypothetical protein